MSKHTPGPCKCEIFYNAKTDKHWVQYCPIHAAAPEMAKFIKRVGYEPIGHAETTCQELLTQITNDARTLLTRIEGAE